MRNLDIFNCAALDIMHTSLEKFPNEVAVDPKDIAARVKEYFIENEYNDLDSNSLFSTCHATIMWLYQEGFIIIKQSYRSGECRIVLTQKGLSALNSVPRFADDEKQSFGQYFLEGVKPLPFSLIGTLMSDFFKTIS